MVTGWRRAFCTSIPKEREPKIATEKPPPQSTHNSTTPITTPTNTTTATASNHRSPRFGSKFIFFSSSSSTTTTTTTTPAGSNSSTPRLQTPPVSSPSLRCRTTASVSVPPPSTTPSPIQDSTTPRLQCKTGKSPRFFHRNSNPSSPRSPSTFSLIKNTLRISKTRCGICVQSIKAGQGTAIFTAECSHTFHFPCIASHVGKNGGLVCPVCASNWKELPLLAVQKYAKSSQDNKAFSAMKISDLKVYNDDESLLSSPNGARFNPIPESDEHDEDGKSESESGTEEFQGFFVNNPTIVTTPRSARSLIQEMINRRRDIEVRISHEAAVVAVGRSYESYAVVVKIRAPPPPPSNLSRRPPVDLVAVLDVGGGITVSRLQMIKRTMRLVISSLSSIDRLSIVAFSANSKRLLPFRRMTSTGRRSARRITDALMCSQGSCVNDALRKAAKVIQDRREKNPATSIILLSDGPDEKASNANQRSRQFPFVSSTRYSPLEIPVHWLNIGAYESSSHGRDWLSEEDLTKSIGGLLSVVVSDLRLQIGFSTGSATAEISGVYSCTGRPGLLRAGSAKLGDMYAEEEREILLELKAPSTATGTHHFLTVRSSCKDPATQELINGKEHAVIVPRPHTIRSSDPSIQRLRSLFVVTRAVAESRRLIDRKDFNGAHHLLSSARALLMQRNTDGSADCYLCSIEAEMAELHWRRQMEMQEQEQGRRRVGAREKEMTSIDEKGQPLTPTSAWKAAEKLAKVAVMRKSMNRVSDLHGFENARF